MIAPVRQPGVNRYITGAGARPLHPGHSSYAARPELGHRGGRSWFGPLAALHPARPESGRVGMPEGWRAGVGITAMRERVAELGGELVIEPRLPRGTRIAARLPVGSHRD